MSETDLKYLLSAYQQKSFDIFTQLIASEAKVKNLTDLTEALKVKIVEMSEELEKLKKTKRSGKSEEDFS